MVFQRIRFLSQTPTLGRHSGRRHLLLHFDVVTRKRPVFRAEHTSPMLKSVTCLFSCQQRAYTYHQSLSLSVFFSTVITSPFLNPKSPGCSASNVNSAIASFFFIRFCLLWKFGFGAAGLPGPALFSSADCCCWKVLDRDPLPNCRGSWS